jgi:hypothetical protein
VVVDDRFLPRFVVLFLDDGGVFALARLIALDNRSVAITVVVTMIGANRYTGSYRTHSNANRSVFGESGCSQGEPGRSNKSYSKFHHAFL